jgi:L-amino acid N-acyltransferase YncA
VPPTEAVTIRDAEPTDLTGVAAIYDDIVRFTHASLELEPPGVTPWETTLAGLSERDAFLVGVDESGAVLGFAYSHQFRPRAGFLGTREPSVYLAESARGAGLGPLLYTALIERLRSAGNRTLVAIVGLPNPASVALHERLGFTLAGTLPDVGEKFDRQITLSLWTLSLDD